MPGLIFRIKERWKKLLRHLSGKRVDCPVSIQMEIIECGAVSLGMVLAYYGKYVPIEVLRDACGVSRDGSSASSLLKAARHFGLESQGYREANIEGLDNHGLPVILFWNFNHFVVYTGRSGDTYYLNDPATGRRTVSRREMDEAFSGILLKFKKGLDFKADGKRNSFARSIFSRMRTIKSGILFIFLAGLFLVPLDILVPNFSSIFIDGFMMGGNYSWCTPLIILALLTLSLLLGFTYLQQVALIDLNMKLSIEASGKFFYHMLRLPIQFFSSRSAGELSCRIDGNDIVANFLASKLASNMLNFITLFFYAWLLFNYDFVLGLCSVGTAAVMIILLKAQLKSRRLLGQTLQQDIGRLNGASASGVMLIETLKSTGGESDYFSYWNGVQTNAALGRKKLEVSSMLLNTLPTTLIALNTAMIICVGAYRVLSGTMSAGNLLAFQLVAGYFFAPITALVAMSSSLQEMDATMARLDDAMKYREDPELEVEENLPLTDGQACKLDGYLEIKNISFGYNPVKPPILNNFSLKLAPGERVALVGASGSGKSTIARIIAGLYQPWGGEILFDGKQRREIPSEVFASSFASVDQDIFMFKGTIYDNLTMRNSAIGMEAVENAVRDAAIHDEVSRRPSGYFSMVEEDGANFSGGQRQRLEIARALAVNPSLLLLDEATSALDPVTEMHIDRNIRRRGCTTIIVAHRLSTIRDADRIIVLENGSIAEEGTHEELMALNNKYASLIRSM